LPLNLFVILAIIQYGLIAQARILAKYAAYRAVRVGAMNHADVTKMQDAATLTLLPVIALPWGASLAGAEGYKPVKSALNVGARLKEVQLLDIALGKISPSARTVTVVICGPTAGDFSGVTQSDLGTGSSDQLDFDDPRV